MDIENSHFLCVCVFFLAKSKKIEFHRATTSNQFNNGHLVNYGFHWSMFNKNWSMFLHTVHLVDFTHTQANILYFRINILMFFPLYE